MHDERHSKKVMDFNTNGKENAKDMGKLRGNRTLVKMGISEDISNNRKVCTAKIS